MISRFFRHLIESIKSLKRNGWMTVAAVSTVMITLSLVAIFVSVILNAAKLGNDIANNVQVVVHLRQDIHDDSKRIVQDGQEVDNASYHKVYDELVALPNVEKVEFSSKEEELDKLVKVMGEDWKLFQGDANPLYDTYIVSTTDHQYVNEVAEKVKAIEEVAEVEDGGTNTQKIFGLSNFIQTWGLGLAAALVFIAVFLISNTIRITIISRSREIQIMRLVGAKSSYIRGPFLLEGAWIGFLGALLPAALVYFGYDIAFQSFNPALAGQNLSMIMPDIFIPVMIGGLFVIGIIIGSIGSGISMRKYLKI